MYHRYRSAGDQPGFNPADVQPNARILLSAAITVNDKLVFITDTVQPVI
ncbi:YbaY family lipoprotein, partial [Vibrio splendidus]